MMLRRLVIRVILLIYSQIQIQGITIEYPASAHINERIRNDIGSIDPIFRYYITPREIQFHADALKGGLPFFLQCQGSKNSIKFNFTVPPTAIDHLSLDTDYNSQTIIATLRQNIGSQNSTEFTVPPTATDHLSLDADNNSHTTIATLPKNKLPLDLVGRYTCFETINDKKYETSVYVFIDDGNSVFTKELYPKVLQQTGIHFFNIPCQTTSWYPRMSCPTVSDPKGCKPPECTSKERQVNELKCNIPICDGEDICIPVYYTPSDLEASKIFFDPQMGFALENQYISDPIIEFTCRSNYTPSQISKIPYDSLNPEDIKIHQTSLSVMPDETVRLSCEIQYGTNLVRKIPSIFWFEDIYNLNLIANDTEKAVFNPQTQVYSRNSSITLRGFKAKKVYRFYCVRVSEQGIYSRSVEISCVDTPSLDLVIRPKNPDSSYKVSFGSDSSYDILIITIPRSKIEVEITRNGDLFNDKRFKLIPIADQESQFLEYTLTIYNITFEDETELEIKVKSSAVEKNETLKLDVIGNPVGQFAFVSNQIPRQIPWRDEDFKSKMNIYSYGIFEGESYRVVCTVHHRSDIEQPLNVFIQHIQCSMDNCLSDIIDNTCRSTTGQRLPMAKSNRISDYYTQFSSSDSQILDDPSIGHQYLCCYEKSGLIVLAKALTALARNREMFSVREPEFSLVTGDVLTYRCESHNLIYDDLQMTYNDGLRTYERNHIDPEWHVVGTKQPQQIDIKWSSSPSENIRHKAIEVTTQPFKNIGKNGFLQCRALSKRPDVIKNTNNTYIINVDDPIPLQFKNNLPSVIRINQKASTDVEFDCSYNGRPQPKITWLKGKLPLAFNDSTFQFRENNGSLYLTRAQAPNDTGYYTCELTNGRDPKLTRSFDLRVEDPNFSSKFRRLTAMFIIISACLILILLIPLIIVVVKYLKMKRYVDQSYFHLHLDEPEDKSQPPMTQLTRIRLPDNFASTQQVRTLLSYVNGDTLPTEKEDFKELGHGQYGVVYQVNLPDVDLVAAKLLPQSIRNIEHRRDKPRKNDDIEENQEMIAKNQEDQKKKAAEMLIDEIKVMFKAGKHVNIVSLLKVAYPEAKLRFLLRGGVIRDEDSFYLMELCSNGSLESMLKHFLQSSISSNSSEEKLSLYESLSKQTDRGMTISQALDSCQLTDDDLKLIAYQVANGVDYLNRIQIAHCDIAARNVLVSSRFIMKICDFGLAACTTYKNYREQLAQHDSVQLEKKNNELATHNLTPELARAFLCVSRIGEGIILNKPSMKSDVWSFGIFLWTLFLKCRIRPFNQLSEEVKKRSDGQSFFHQLARVVSEGRVLEYINYRSEIPEKIYAIIRVCLVDESERPEMSKIRSYFLHQNMLSKQAFEYYKSEYNHYQEENATDEKVVRFGDVLVDSDLPSFDGKNTTDRPNLRIDFRRNKNPPNHYIRTPTNETSPFDVNDSQQKNDSYLEPITQPRTICENASDEMIESVEEKSDSYLEPITHPRTIGENASDEMIALVEEKNDSYLVAPITESRTIVGNASDETIALVEEKNDSYLVAPITESRTIVGNASDEMIALVEEKNDSYFVAPITKPRTIVGNVSDEMARLVQQNDGDSSSQTRNIPRVITENRTPFRTPPFTTKRDDFDDSYA